MRDWRNDEQKEFTNRQICSINGFKLRTRPSHAVNNIINYNGLISSFNFEVFQVYFFHLHV